MLNDLPHLYYPWQIVISGNQDPKHPLRNMDVDPNNNKNQVDSKFLLSVSLLSDYVHSFVFLYYIYFKFD